LRFVLYSLVLVVGLLATANIGVEQLEERKVIDTRRPDDFVQNVDRPLFELDSEGTLTTTDYAETTMVRSSFPKARGGAWRMFVLGGSFAMGTPYAYQPGPAEPGGMPWFLRHHLKKMYPDQQIQVINMASGGQNSQRVKHISQKVIEYEPNMLLIATCNNEGVLPPSIISEPLRKFGIYRLMTRLMMPGVRPEERSYYTPQHPDLHRLRDNFKENLEAIITLGKQHEVQVVLATLPVNLRYTGTFRKHVIGEDRGKMAGELPPCIRRAAAPFRRGDNAAARALLGECDDPEAIRLLGLIQYASGEYARARRSLEQYTEAVPRNRCRPSFNRIIRDLAAAHPEVVLVDLARRAAKESRHGVPGYDLFLDFCHMTWQGNLAMAEEVIEVLQARGLSPKGEPRRGVIPSIKKLSRIHKFPTTEQQYSYPGVEWHNDLELKPRKFNLPKLPAAATEEGP